MQATYIVDHAAEYLRAKHDRPFFMMVSFYEPHSPFNFPRGWRGRFKPGPFPVRPRSERDRREQPEVFASLSPDDFRSIQAAYYTSLSFLDAEVGRLLKALDESGLSGQTLVVYLGDNGYMLGQHGRFEKHCFYEPAVRIPLIMRWPGCIESQRRASSL